jgi:hypothetical protein
MSHYQSTYCALVSICAEDKTEIMLGRLRLRIKDFEYHIMDASSKYEGNIIMETTWSEAGSVTRN